MTAWPAVCQHKCFEVLLIAEGPTMKVVRGIDALVWVVPDRKALNRASPQRAAGRKRGLIGRVVVATHHAEKSRTEDRAHLRRRLEPDQNPQ